MTTPRDVLAYTAKLPRLDGAGGSPALLVPVWTRAGGAAFAASIDQFAALLGVAGDPTPPEGLAPAGGNDGQVLRKRTSTDFDYEWTSIPVLPSGGAIGQVLRKRSLVEGDTEWATLAVFTSSVAGLAPASGGGTTNFLRADGAWAAPPGGGGGGGNNYFPGGWA